MPRLIDLAPAMQILYKETTAEMEGLKELHIRLFDEVAVYKKQMLVVVDGSKPIVDAIKRETAQLRAYALQRERRESAIDALLAAAVMPPGTPASKKRRSAADCERRTRVLKATDPARAKLLKSEKAQLRYIDGMVVKTKARVDELVIERDKARDQRDATIATLQESIDPLAKRMKEIRKEIAAKSKRLDDIIAGKKLRK